MKALFDAHKDTISFRRAHLPLPAFADIEYAPMRKKVQDAETRLKDRYHALCRNDAVSTDTLEMIQHDRAVLLAIEGWLASWIAQEAK